MRIFLLIFILLDFTYSAKNIRADVTDVRVNKNNFSVTIKSDETGCKQYANWWEVLDKSGNLIYRRVLFHSHSNEQPFTRSGGPVKIAPNKIVYIRAHMNNVGYVGDIFKGSIQNGFAKDTNPPNFSNNIESLRPLPRRCWF